MEKLTIALAQCNFLVGDIDGNADRIIAITTKYSEEKNIDLIVFPELALSGYPPEDLLFRPGFYKRCERAMSHIIKSTKDTAIIIGYPARDSNLLFNKAAFIYQGKIIADYAKQELPNYTVFDEKRYFTPGEKSCVVKFKNFKIGLLICEDLWHAAPIAKAKKAGAELIVSINASPFDKNQVRARENTLKKRVTETQLPIVYCNIVGGQDELVFDGGSMTINAKGNRCLQAPYFSESIVTTSVTRDTNSHIVGIEKHELPPRLSQESQIYHALTLGVHDYIAKNHFPGALVGLSGGIDSALTLAIAVDAIGANKVTAVLMPSPYTAKISIEDAIAEAKALNVNYHIIEIEPLLSAFLKALSPLFVNTSPDATEENLQARIRGMLLMALSNKFGKIVLTTGNKSEMSVGYATLYGDMAGGGLVI